MGNEKLINVNNINFGEIFDAANKAIDRISEEEVYPKYYITPEGCVLVEFDGVGTTF